MDLEKNRIPTRIRLPHIPVTAPFASTLPTSVYRGTRIAGTATAFVLRELGVSDEVLCSSESARDAIEEHSDARVPRNLFSAADELWAKKKCKKAYEQLSRDLTEHKNYLTDVFGAAPFAVAQAQVNKVLANYQIADNS